MAAMPSRFSSSASARGHRSFGIRTLITALIVASFLPGLLAGGVILRQLYDAEEAAAETLMLETARALSVALDHEVGGLDAELGLLAASQSMKSGDIAAVYERATELAKAVPESWVALRDREGGVVFDTRRDYGSAPSGQGDRENGVRTAAERSGAGISSVLIATSPRPVAMLRAPVPESAESRLEMAVPAEHFAGPLDGIGLPAGWLAAVVDGAGSVVARRPSPNGDAADGLQSDLLAQLKRKDEGAYSAGDNAGIPMLGAFTRSKLTGWSIVIGAPKAMEEAPFRRSLVELMAVGIALALGGVALAGAVSRRMRRPIRSLARAAEALGHGMEPVRPEGGIKEIERASQALLDTAESLKQRSAERDAAFAALRNANDMLERRVGERTRALDQANRQLADEIERRRQAEAAMIQRRKLEAIGRLTADVAHDFNNLLTAIVGNIGLLLRRLSDAHAVNLAQRSLKAAELAATVTKQLLAFGRRQYLDTRAVDLNDFVAGVAPLLRASAGPAVVVETRFGENCGSVIIDAEQLELALVNLTTNARDAMPEGGRIVIETSRIVATAHPHVAAGDWAVISFSDTGLGMPPEVVAQAFEPFFTTKKQGAGTGLGLSMVHGLVKQLGGEVVIQSEPGAGTSVFVYLPQSNVAVLRPMTTAAAQPVTAGKAHAIVLLVDDNPEVREVMATSLREAGHQVVEASTAFEALDLFDDGAAFDVAVVDYAMPGMPGTGAIVAMLRRRPDMPILLVTGFADAGELQRWPKRRILFKPFSPERLVQRIAELLEASGNGAGKGGVG
jgi:signal transduction histidine kinase